MIELQNVTFVYPNGILALDNVTLKITDEITIIMGANGSGKTTLLKILACLYKPTRGRVLIDGRDFWVLNKKERLKIRRKIVYIHENPVLFRGTVLENIMYPLIVRDHHVEEARKKALSIVEKLGIKHLINRRRQELSAGEAQLVAFARAIVADPEYILMDEPTNALDSEKREIVENFIIQLVKKRRKFVIATHDRLLAARLSSKIIELSEGKILRISSSNELLAKIKSILFQKDES